MTNVDDTHVTGRLISDRYRIVARIGEGGVGTVYEVEHVGMAKTMAMKLLRAELSAVPEVQERFEREAQSAAKLDDPRVVRVTDFGKHTDGSLYLVMELVDGEPLSKYLTRAHPLEEKLALIDELLAGLEHAHGQTVIHRDLKPDNIMVVTKEGRPSVKILDFGLAKSMGPGTDAPLTRAGMVFGTPRYMAPEQAAGDPADHRADLYAVGVILYEALTGAPPFVADSAMSVLMKHINEPPPPLIVDDLDDQRVAQLASVLDRALTKDPDARFDSAGSFRAALQAVVASESAPATTAPSSVASPLAEPDPIADTAVRPREAPAGVRSVSIEPKTNRRPLIFFGIAIFSALIAFAMMVGGGPESVEAALDRGDLAAARTAAVELGRAHPNDPTTFLALGHLALAEDDAKAAHEAFGRALELDHDIAAEYRFANEILARAKTDAPPASSVIADIAKRGGLGSVPFLATAFGVTPSAAVRRRAFAGLERLEATDQVEDALARLTADLKATGSRDCAMRRWYLTRIVKFDKSRVDATLREEAARRGPLGTDVNGCMKDLLGAHLDADAKPE